MPACRVRLRGPSLVPAGCVMMRQVGLTSRSARGGSTIQRTEPPTQNRSRDFIVEAECCCDIIPQSRSCITREKWIISKKKRILAVTPGPKALETILERCGIELEQVQLELLWRYHQMLRKANAELNLTRIHQFESMVLKHYVDSLLVLRYVELPASLIDMGSGPGLPGIPLKIARPEVQMILAEQRGARAAFLRGVCEQLGLERVDVYAHKVGPDYPGQVGGVISRAVGPIGETLDRVTACLGPGARMLFMKGPECDAEVVEAATSHAGIFRLVADHPYSIPGTPHRRRAGRLRTSGRRAVARAGLAVAPE